MKTNRTVRFRYWAFVLAISGVIVMNVARHEGIALAMATLGVAIVLGYIVDLRIC